MTSRPELLRLSKPFPAKFVAKKEGADYVNHAIVQQRLLGTVGPFDMRVDHIIRGPIAEKITGKGTPKEKVWPAADNAVVGVVLTCTFTIDGERVEVSEVGTPEGYYMAPHDGERLKKAMSDALKRCAMRVGVGLDLWSKGTYVLPAMLEQDQAVEDDAPEPDHDAPDPDDIDTEDVPDDSSGGGGEVPPPEAPACEGTRHVGPVEQVGLARTRCGACGAIGGPKGPGTPEPDEAAPADAEPAPDEPSWRTVAQDLGVPPVAVLAAIVKSWPSNNMAARPNNLKDVDRLAAKPEYRDLVRATVEDIAAERQAAS